MSDTFYTPPGLAQDDPEFQRREEAGLSVMSMHVNDRASFEATRSEIEAWFTDQFPNSSLLWAGGGNMHSRGRMWHRWLPETAAQATVLRLFWG
jgi:hypothetical protein